jgi:hypothetical protein
MEHRRGVMLVLGGFKRPKVARQLDLALVLRSFESSVQ